MKHIAKAILALTLFVGTAAQAAEIRVKFSVVDGQSLSPIDWQSGWGTIHVYAKNADGEIFYPDYENRDGDGFIFPEAGRYTFHGDGAYVCGLSNGQEIDITPHIVEIRLFGWCE